MLTYVLAVVVLGMIVIRSTDDTVNPAVSALGLTALLVITAAFLLPAGLRRFGVQTRAWFPYLVAGISALFSMGPWLLTALGQTSAATAIYQGLRVPPGIVQFWDLDLVLQSVDCAQVGVDVYSSNNGCLQDPSIYAPGTLWLGYIPGDIFSSKNSVWLGFVALIISTVMVLWLARNSSARGQLALLVSVLGAGWLLILERGNFDLFVMWIAVLAVVLVRRWPYLWSWSIAAALIWIAGTWKYYPFAMGIMLIPLLFIKHGWIVLSGFVIATLAFVIFTWENVMLSMEQNAGMVDLGDFVVLGRVPLAARMLGGDGNSATYGLPDLLIAVLALLALIWGMSWAWSTNRSRVIFQRAQYPAMLAAAGSAMFLIAVLVSGFGYGYKSAFLLLLIPFLSRPTKALASRVFVPSAISLILVALSCVVVWNTAVSTTAGIIAAAFALGAAGTVLVGQFFVRSPQAVAHHE